MVTENKNDDKELITLKMVSALKGADPEALIKEVVDDFMLLTYDIPATDEGNKVRTRFLKEARWLGAVPHTESVFLMPRTKMSELAAIQVARAGHAFVWIAQPTSSEEAVALTRDYDKQVTKVFENLEERLGKIAEHIGNEKYGLAGKMLDRTSEMVDSLVKIATQRGSLIFLNQVVTIREGFLELQRQSLGLKSASSKGPVKKLVTISDSGDLTFSNSEERR